MQHQLNIFILGFGALQGLLLGLLLIRTQAYRGNSWFLLLYLLTLLVQICMKVASKMWLTSQLPTLYHLSYNLPFLYGPLLWLFLKRTLSPRTRTSGELWHFLPFFIFAGINFAALFDSSFQPWCLHPQTAINLQLLSLITYHGLALNILQQKGAGLDIHKLKWLKAFSIGSFFLSLTLSLALYLMSTLYPAGAELRYLFAVATLFIYWVSYKIMRHPDLFLPSPNDHNSEAQPLDRKYNNSSLKNTDRELILQQLDIVMRQQHPYLDPKLSIEDLAALVGSNRHHLSQVLNEGLQKNYYEYLNTYRVEAAQMLLLDPRQAHLKIAAIAYSAGFNSLSTFNEVFKKMVGCTPSEFKRMEQHKKELYQSVLSS